MKFPANSLAICSFLLGATLVLLPAPSSAQDGSLDVAYNPNTDQGVTYITIQPDGKALVSGPLTSVGGVARPHLARLNEDGSLDASFSPDPDFSLGGPTAVQADGKVLTPGGSNFLIRLNADGSRDSTFSSTAAATSGGGIRSIVVLPDGKILVGGGFNQFAGVFTDGVARLNADGSFDPSFVSKAGFFLGAAIAMLPDGSLFVGGGNGSGNAAQPTELAHLDTNGALLASYDALPAANQSAEINQLGLQSDGKLVISGRFASIQGVPRANVARLNADGSVDMSFDPGAGAANFDTILALSVQFDDKIVVGGGFTTFSGMPRSRIARLNADGSVDMSFDPGAGADRPGGEFSGVFSLGLQLDGGILVGGDFSAFAGMPRNGLARVFGEPSPILTTQGGKQANLKVRVRDLSAKLNAKGTKTIVKGILTLINSGTKSAKNVEIAVYLSADATLDVGKDIALGTISLADYGFAKLAKKSRNEIPLRFPGPAALHSVLSGRYIIVIIDPNSQVPDSDRSNNQLVIGPLP